jgi:translation elongation factor P/translation initiation factor 5A
MKRLTAFSLLVIMFCSVALAQQSRIQIISSSPEKTVLKVLVTGFDWKTVQTVEGDAKVISLENGVQINKAGAPDLPKLMTMVPFASTDVKIETEFVSYTDFEDMTVALTAAKTVADDEDNSDFRRHENYSSDEFFPRRVVRKKKQKFLNDGSLLLAIRPVQYNGATKTVRLWNELIITITANNSDQTVSIPENMVSEFTIYPNLSLDILTVSYELETQSTVSLDMYNLAGQSVYSKNKGSQAACLQTATLDVSNFAPGMYSLALRTDKGTSVKRIVVE